MLLAIIVSVATVFAAYPFKSEKIKGSPLGFFSLRSPVTTWNSLDEKNRLTGDISKVIEWDAIQEITVLYAVLHIRGPKDTEDYIKKFIGAGKLTPKIDKNIKVDTSYEDKKLSLQALLKLKNGKVALVSISPNYVIVELDRKIGLKKKKS